MASKDKTVFQFTVKGNYNYKVTVRLGEALGLRWEDFIVLRIMRSFRLRFSAG